MHHSLGAQDERVGGNTPIMDMDDPLMEGNMMGQSSAFESLFHALPSPSEGNCADHILHTLQTGRCQRRLRGCSHWGHLVRSFADFPLPPH